MYPDVVQIDVSVIEPASGGSFEQLYKQNVVNNIAATFFIVKLNCTYPQHFLEATHLPLAALINPKE